VAIRLGECKLQEDINIENLDRLQYYFARYRYACCKVQSAQHQSGRI